MDQTASTTEIPQLISYLTLRKSVGILGIAFPIVLVVGSVVCGPCVEIQSSISAYYHTDMRNLFVGLLCAIALFLFAYKGYNQTDTLAGNLAGLFALGVAFFPASITEPLSQCIPQPIDNHLIGTLHFISAAGLFLVLAFFSLVLFTKQGKQPTKMKLKRNKLYRICGYIMLGCIGLILLYGICRNHQGCLSLQKYDPVFWLESLALWAFGLSWLTKGKTLFTDQ